MLKKNGGNRMTKRKKYLRRIYAILLALFMVTTALPQSTISALAAEGSSEKSVTEMALGSDISAAADSDGSSTISVKTTMA